MSNVKVQMKSKAQMTKLKKEKVLTLSNLDIHLAFACLPQAGILTFELFILIVENLEWQK
jgi:hypothetical protein